VTPFECFHQVLLHQKTKSPGLSCGTVGLILRLAILVEHGLVTDTKTQSLSIDHVQLSARSKIYYWFHKTLDKIHGTISE